MRRPRATVAMFSSQLGNGWCGPHPKALLRARAPPGRSRASSRRARSPPARAGRCRWPALAHEHGAVALERRAGVLARHPRVELGARHADAPSPEASRRRRRRRGLCAGQRLREAPGRRRARRRLPRDLADAGEGGRDPARRVDAHAEPIGRRSGGLEARPSRAARAPPAPGRRRASGPRPRGSRRRRPARAAPRPRPG